MTGGNAPRMLGKVTATVQWTKTAVNYPIPTHHDRHPLED